MPTLICEISKGTAERLRRAFMEDTGIRRSERTNDELRYQEMVEEEDAFDSWFDKWLNAVLAIFPTRGAWRWHEESREEEVTEMDDDKNFRKDMREYRTGGHKG